jgi:hypothetical protein
MLQKLTKTEKTRGNERGAPPHLCYINEANIKEDIIRSQNMMLSDGDDDDDDEGACIVRTRKRNYKVMC